MELYLVTKITNRFIPYEPVNENSVDVIGVFDNKESIQTALKELNLTNQEVNIKELNLNDIAYDKNSSYSQGLTSLFGWSEEYSTYYENDAKTVLIFEKQ